MDDLKRAATLLRASARRIDESEYREEMLTIADRLEAARVQVPREPTDLMLVCGWGKYAREGDVHDICAAIWRAMYDASPINALHQTED